MTYSIIGILAAVILLINNRDVLWNQEGKALSQTQRNYRGFLMGVLCYYVTDALWGILEARGLTVLLYADTAIHFAAMAAAVMLWTKYVVSYLESENVFDRVLYQTGRVFFAFELVVVAVNFFYPVLFWFDDSGAYHAGAARYLTLAIQILMFLLTSVHTLRITARASGKVRLRHRTIGWFGIAMMLLIGVQLFYPLLPLYAMGYMLGTCLLHSFVVEDEKEDYRRELEEAVARERLQRQELTESREALKDALAEAEYASRAKTNFLNNMSHDIRTPMNAIVGFTALASSHLDEREMVKDYLEKITVSSQHLLSLINDVLDMSRIESGKMALEESEVHLPDMIRDLRAIVQPSVEAKQQELLIDTQDMIHEDIVIDRLRLNQIFLNLLSNAVKFTPGGGTISLRVVEKPAMTEDLTTFAFHIKDTGIGMSTDFASTIFDPFTREKTSTVSGIQGTGLGMAITKSIVDMMGGTITVSSEVGRGTEFVVTIPCKLSRATENNAPEAAPAKERPDFAGRRILLAEDNEMNRMIAEAILTEQGFALDLAPNGEQAVAMVSEAPAGTYDVILMDIQMPVMDGDEAARQIRALADPQKAKIPIVAVTANAFEEDRKLALSAGMNGHLAKPYDIPAMLETLGRLLNP